MRRVIIGRWCLMISKIYIGKSFKYELGPRYILFFYILINNKCCGMLVLFFFFFLKIFLIFLFLCFFIMWIRWNWNVNKFKKSDNIKKFHKSYTIKLVFSFTDFHFFGIISIVETLLVRSFTRCSS